MFGLFGVTVRPRTTNRAHRGSYQVNRLSFPSVRSIIATSACARGLRALVGRLQAT